MLKEVIQVCDIKNVEAMRILKAFTRILDERQVYPSTSEVTISAMSFPAFPLI